MSIPGSPPWARTNLVLKNDFLHYFANSLMVTLASVVVTLAVALMASYYVDPVPHAVRLHAPDVPAGAGDPHPGHHHPGVLHDRKLGLYDSLIALVLPSIAFSIPISVLIILNFLRDIPGELFESMHMDGANDWRTLRSLALPLTRPALMTVGMYVGLNVWNGFLFPLVLTQSSSVRVLRYRCGRIRVNSRSTFPRFLPP